MQSWSAGRSPSPAAPAASRGGCPWPGCERPSAADLDRAFQTGNRDRPYCCGHRARRERRTCQCVARGQGRLWACTTLDSPPDRSTRTLPSLTTSQVSVSLTVMRRAVPSDGCQRRAEIGSASRSTAAALGRSKFATLEADPLGGGPRIEVECDPRSSACMNGRAVPVGHGERATGTAAERVSREKGISARRCMPPWGPLRS
jgi:hypothetical protein